MIISNYTMPELSEVAQKLLFKFYDIKVWCFNAEMGAGKTTLIKEIGKHLGIEDEVNSPTFSIINEYEKSNGELVYHFDFYRLRKIDEVIDLGIEDYFFSGNLCLLEWPDLVYRLLPEQYLEIKINLVDAKSRSITAIPK